MSLVFVAFSGKVTCVTENAKDFSAVIKNKSNELMGTKWNAIIWDVGPVKTNQSACQNSESSYSTINDINVKKKYDMQAVL